MEITSYGNNTSILYGIGIQNPKDKKTIGEVNQALSSLDEKTTQLKSVEKRNLDYKTTAINIEEHKRVVDEGNKKLEITEIKKTIERQKLDIMA